MNMDETSLDLINHEQRRMQNKVWQRFLEIFYVEQTIDGKHSNIKLALSHCLEPLKEMAEKEDWGRDNIILVNYFVYTFYYLWESQEKQKDGRFIVEYNDWIYFHTGLITENMESIYARVKRNFRPGAKGGIEKGQYYLIKDSKYFLREVKMTCYCNPLPGRCRYFNDYTQLIMDETKMPVVNWHQIIDENWIRICDVLQLGKQMHDDDSKASRQYNAQIRLRGALTRTLNRVHAKYRTAVPHSFQGEMQLLLPLCIRKENEPDLVLSIAREEYKPPKPGMFTYMAKTIFTLDMAYQNARLIARPENDWLFPPANVTESYDDLFNYEPRPSISS